jgi:imidazolonepropionase-like amidohydrolase
LLASIGRGHSHGAISAGRVGDFVVIDSPNWEAVVYDLGGENDSISFVVKGGGVVWSKDGGMM